MIFKITAGTLACAIFLLALAALDFSRGMEDTHIREALVQQNLLVPSTFTQSGDEHSAHVGQEKILLNYIQYDFHSSAFANLRDA